MAAQLHSVCGGAVWLIMHDEFGQLGTLSQSPDADGFYVLTLIHPTKWHVVKNSIVCDERANEIHKFRTRAEARDFLIAKFYSRFVDWN
jgi:hypothetical protein